MCDSNVCVCDSNVCVRALVGVKGRGERGQEGKGSGGTSERVSRSCYPSPRECRIAVHLTERRAVAAAKWAGRSRCREPVAPLRPVASRGESVGALFLLTTTGRGACAIRGHNGGGVGILLPLATPEPCLSVSGGARYLSCQREQVGVEGRMGAWRPAWAAHTAPVQARSGGRVS